MEDGQDEKEDTSSAKLIGLYIISDMLHGCDTAGVRNAWKYKGLVEKAFRDQRVFEHLGRVERDMKWGRVKGDRWKSRVTNLLDIWSGWSLYSADVMQNFVETFKNPPLTEEEKAADEKERMEREARRKAQKKKAPIVRQSSEPAKSEEPVDRKSATAPVTKDEVKAPEKMDIDDGPKDTDAPMEDIDKVGGDDIFGLDGASDERKKEDDLAAVKARVQANLKAIASKGSKRPSTRELLK
jgi:U2-associated protein SR140